tara:strand:+ start:336 stop:1070 length:735 start_codon:yes stop_codon:yes gene_type:complete
MRTLIALLLLSLFASKIYSQSIDTLYFNEKGNQISNSKVFSYFEVQTKKGRKLHGQLIRVKRDSSEIEKLHYKRGELDGPYWSISKTKGITTQGKYLNALKSGIWTTAFLSGEQYYVEKYNDEGILTERTASDNEVRNTLELKETTPEYFNDSDSWNQHLMKNLRYPREATRAGYEGVVVHKFIVLKNGLPANVKWLNEGEVAEVLADEAKRVMLLYSTFQPYYDSKGAAVNHYRVLTTTFKFK